MEDEKEVFWSIRYLFIWDSAKKKGFNCNHYSFNASEVKRVGLI